MSVGWGQEMEWDQAFGGFGGAGGNSVQQTTDGGYIIVGVTISPFSGDGDIWLIKTNSLGEQEWNRTFGGSESDNGQSVQQTTDGGYIISGYTRSFGNGGKDFWLIKTNSFGEEEWNRTFGGSDQDEGGQSVQQTIDGGYIIIGVTKSFGNGNEDVWLIKTNSFGEEEWNRTFGTSGWEGGYSVQQTTDDGYIITGYTSSFGNGSADVWLIKTNAFGEEEWNRTFGGSNQARGYSVQQTIDGGYIVTGYITQEDGWSDIYLIKTDENGDEVWIKTFDGGNDDYGQSVQQTVDGGYIIVGFTHSFGGTDVLLIKTNSLGEEDWIQNYGGGIESDFGRSVQQTTDGGYIIVGNSYSFGNTSSVWLIKICGDENENCGGFDDVTCEYDFIEIDGNSYCQDDLMVLQDIIDLNGLTSESSILDDYDTDGLVDDQDSVFEPLELAFQVWSFGRLSVLDFMADVIYESYGYEILYLPESIYMFDELSWLNISEVGLVEFPNTIGNLTNLTGLDAWRNNLTDDSFPDSMNNLVHLSGISLDGNQLTSIPNFIEHTSSSLSYLYFGFGYWGTGNQIEYFPEWWSYTYFPILSTLDLSNNYLKELPEISNTNSLYSLTLWNNHLTSLDGIDWLCDLSIMGTQIYLQDNYICDEIPECIDEVVIGNQKGCEIVITDNPGAYEFTATIVGGIVLSDGVQMGECNEVNANGLCLDDTQDIFAAFDSDGNVRGIALMLFPPFGPNEGTPVYEMQLRSNDEGDILNFQYYDTSENLVFDITETYQFEINDILGSVVDPVFYNINTEVEADPSNWYEPEDGSVIIDMGWGVYHSIIINNSILSFMDNGYNFYIIDLYGGLGCENNGEIELNQITYNQNIDTTYTINVSEHIDYCEFGGSLPGFIAGNSIYYKFSSPEGFFYIEPDEIIGENIFNSDITIINSFDLSSISNDSNSGRSSQKQNNDSKSKRSESNRDEISIKYEIIKNDESIINDYTDVFYLDKNIEPGNEYCYSVIIKDSNDHLIRTTDVECITIESITPDYISGDVTQDGLVNVLDIVMLVDWILSGTSLTDLETSIADMTNDGLVNVLDIVALVDTILNP